MCSTVFIFICFSFCCHFAVAVALNYHKIAHSTPPLYRTHIHDFYDHKYTLCILHISYCTNCFQLPTLLLLLQLERLLLLLCRDSWFGICMRLLFVAHLLRMDLKKFLLARDSILSLLPMLFAYAQLFEGPMFFRSLLSV